MHIVQSKQIQILCIDPLRMQTTAKKVQITVNHTNNPRKIATLVQFL